MQGSLIFLNKILSLTDLFGASNAEELKRVSSNVSFRVDVLIYLDLVVHVCSKLERFSISYLNKRKSCLLSFFWEKKK